MTASHAPHPINLKTLRQHLRERLRALRCLLADCQFSPLSGSSGRPQLHFAIDWADVHAYIFGQSDPPPSDDVLGGEATGFDFQGAYQAALSFLLNKFPSPLIVLPPHSIELKREYRGVRRGGHKKIIAQQQAIDDFKREYSGLPGDIRNVLKDFRQQSLRGHSAVATIDEDAKDGEEDLPLRAAPQEDVNKFFKERGVDLQALVRDHFAQMFRVIRSVRLQELGTFYRLLKPGAHGGLPKLVDIDDVLPHVAGRVPRLLRRRRRWAQFFTEERPEAAEHDEEALAHLEALSCLSEETDWQILFITRADRFRNAIYDDPARFACIRDGYWPGPPSSSGRLVSPVPTLVRDWRYYLELAQHWDFDKDRARTELIRDRMEWVEEGLTFLRGVQGKRWRDWRRDAETYLDAHYRDIRNVQAYMAARGEPLSLVAYGAEGIGRDAWVLAALLEELLGESGAELRETLRCSLSEAEETASGLVPVSRGRRQLGYGEHRRPVLRLFCQQMEPALLDAALTNQQLREACRQHWANLARAAVPDDGQPPQYRVRRANLLERLFEEVLAYHVLAYPVQSRAAPFKLKELLDRTSGPRVLHVMAKLAMCDFYVFVREAVGLADRELNQALEITADASHAMRVCLASCRLALAIDEVEALGEQQNLFPWEAGHPRLQRRLGDCLGLLAREDEDVLPEKVRLAVANNVVYAYCRLLQTLGMRPGEEDLDGDPNQELADYCDGERVSELAAYLEGFTRTGRQVEEHVETIAYFYLKKAMVGMDPAGSAISESRRLYEMLRRGFENRPAEEVEYDRVYRAVVRHHRVLREYEGAHAEK